MGAIRDFLDSVGRTKTPYTGSPIPGPPPADTASTQSLSGAGTARPITSGSVLDTIRNVASNTTPTTTSAPTNDRAAFDESVRKYQLDRRAYEQYNTELNNRLRAFNPYADAQYRVASTTPPAGATSVSVPTAPAPTAPTQLRAPTYGAISQFSNLTPQQQGELYLQQRGIGYTDADIRKATAAQVGTPSEEMMAGIYKTAYPQYTQAIESQYGTQFNRTGYGTGAGQIDYPGYNYYINQLSTGAVTPETLESAIRGGAATTPTPVTTPGTTAPTSDINALYQQYFNRQADPGGLQYWQQSGLTGDALRNAIIAGAQGPDLDYYNNVYNRPVDPGHFAARGGYISKYAEGGRVRTHYQTGGQDGEGNMDELDAFYRDPRNFTRPQNAPIRRSPAASPVMSPSDPGYLDRIVSQPIGTNPRSERNILDPNASYGRMYPANAPRRAPPENLMPIEGVGEGTEITGEAPRRLEGLLPVEGTGEGMPIVAAVPAVEPSAAGGAAATPAGGGSLQDMLERYMQSSRTNASELQNARARAAAESEAFNNMLQNMMNSPESQQASKSEMYFRLAAAFGAPTRTGHMGETLSNVGQQMGEYTRGQRASETERRKLMLEGQKLRMEGSRADLNTLRSLAQEELRDRRALQLAYIQAGRPQSRYGQAAVDMGMRPGTPEFNQYVRERSQQDVENADELARSRALSADLTRRLQEDRSNQLTNREVDLRIETENSIAGAQQSLLDMRDAYRFNENSFEGGLLDRAGRLFLENTNPRAPIVVNTNRLENLLGQQGLEKLKSTFGGQPTEGERKILLELEGIGSKTIEERRQIIQRAYSIVQQRIEREQKRLDDLISGRIRQRTTNQPTGGQ